MKTIYKYGFAEADNEGPVSFFQLPTGAEVLACGMQNGGLFLWAKVDTEAPLDIRAFQLVPTGGEVPDGKFVATVFDAPFVWHIFEVDGGE